MATDTLNITIFFPVYNDEKTVRKVTEKSLTVLSRLATEYEVIIINDGSPDNSGKIADELVEEYEHVRVIHHKTNQGYGAAIKTGLSAARYKWICFTDGDDEYDIFDLIKLIRLRDYYNLIITFRYKRLYSNKRIFISRVYNALLRTLFRTPYRDISTGLRLINKDVVDELNIISDSPFIGAEITIKTMLKGFPVGEVGIQTFPREFGTGNSTTIPNIIATIKDMWRVYREIFSDEYDLPHNRLEQNSVTSK